MRILIIEDEKEIVRFLRLELEHEGYQTAAEYDGRAGLLSALSTEPDIILLDIMLPELNGLEVLRRLRREKDIPVILLTARDTVMDKVTGLDTGANDYITKPFHIEELLARIRAVVRKQTRAAESVLRLDGLELDTDSRRVTCDERPVELTRTQFDLLDYLLRNRGSVLSREQILSEVWGYDYLGDGNIVDVYVRYLRQRLGDKGKIIETVRGVGYVIR